MVEVSFQSSSVYRRPLTGGAAYSPCTAACTNHADQHAYAGHRGPSGCHQAGSNGYKECSRRMPATEEVRMTRLSVAFALAAARSTFCVPFTAGSMRSCCGLLVSMKKGDLHMQYVSHAAFW